MNKFVAFSLFAFIISCSSQSHKTIENRNVGGALGTSYSIIYFEDEEKDYQQQIDSVFKVVNQSLSTYMPTSDISKINKGDTTVVVDQMFREVFELSKVVHEATNGFFDPTVGVLVNAWGFGPGRQIAMDSTKVDSLLNFVGFEKVSISQDNRIFKTRPNIYFDFNAIAKGYAIDRLAAFFDEKDIKDYLLEVGGELVGKGENQTKNKPWVVGIDDPEVEQGRRLKNLIQLKNRALASSGNYRKFRVDSLTGERYVHTVDPKTGFTKNSNTLGVTILADTCAKADAFATAFMAMDLDDALKLLNQKRELEGYIIYSDAKGNVQEFMTEGFKNLIVSSQGE